MRSKLFESTIKEIEAQRTDLPDYVSYFGSQKRKEISANPIFCGSGDSLACAQFVERLTEFKTRAIDPYDLNLYPKISAGKTVYFISVSGRTLTNIRAAKIIKKFNPRKTIAVTANPDSALARNCSEVIELKFTKTPSLTPGTNSFTTSLLACSLLFHKAPKMRVGEMIENAKEWAKESVESLEGAFHFVGSGAFFALALYGAAKIFEFAGGRATYQLTEQFSHLNLFSLDKEKDSVFILRCKNGEDKTKFLDANLTQAGIRSTLLPIVGKNHSPIELAIWYAVHLQFLALEVALRKGLDRPAFLIDKRILTVSDKMIY
ncbi:MAG: SIS domain-containing protein [archaeon]|nr:SIS domain-containing protein [archaeon]